MKDPNLQGQIGPRCELCSGAARVGRLGGSMSACERCMGTGVEPLDPVALRELIASMNHLVARVVALELQVKESAA